MRYSFAAFLAVAGVACADSPSGYVVTQIGEFSRGI